MTLGSFLDVLTNVPTFDETLHPYLGELACEANHEESHLGREGVLVHHGSQWFRQAWCAPHASLWSLGHQEYRAIAREICVKKQKWSSQLSHDAFISGKTLPLCRHLASLVQAVCCQHFTFCILASGQLDKNMQGAARTLSRCSVKSQHHNEQCGLQPVT